MLAPHSQEARTRADDAQVLTLPDNPSRNLSGGGNLGTVPDLRRLDLAVRIDKWRQVLKNAYPMRYGLRNR